MSSKYYITTALHYVNDEPHIGHAYETVLGDVLTRYLRLFGREVHFLTGVDEHGQKIVQAATKAGLTPQEHCDLTSKRFQEVWSRLSIEPDVFFRTTNPDHKRFVENVLSELNDKGEIYSADYSGWYCTPDERFWTDKDVVDEKCPACGRPVEHLTEKNYFFRMSSHQEWLINWIHTHPEFIKPETRRNEVLGFLKQPLGDLCISRPKTRLAWGIPLPFDINYVTYVWFDALLNYLSATRIHPAEGFTPDLWPADLHLIGKDIITTHAVYWPTMLHAAGFEPPKTIFAHGWWLIDGGKMSKSVGNVIKPLDLVDKYGPDAFRYVLMREMTPGQDATFSEEAFIKRYNSDLANDLGNLYSRLAKLWDKFDCEKQPITGFVKDSFEVGEDLKILEEALKNNVINDISDELKPNVAIERILTFIRGINRQLEVWEPWKTGKENPVQLAEALAWSLKGLALAAELLSPVMPTKMSELQGAIGLQNGVPHPQQGQNLFPRIDVQSKPTSADPVQTKINKPASYQDNEIALDDFTKIDLRIGKVLEARRLEGSDKLLVLQVLMAEGARQIVAGIAKSYQPSDLIEKHVVVVSNLKPVKLRGEWSHGMILAVSENDRHFLIQPQSVVSPGTKVK